MSCLALDRIEELLRERKDKDPRAMAAWEAITLPCALLNDTHQHFDGVGDIPPGTCKHRDLLPFINLLPEGAVWGILEHDVCDTLGWEELDYWLLASGTWKARIFHHRGSPWHSGATQNLALASAIIAALLEEANG